MPMPEPMIPGKRPGPTFCPGIRGNDCTCTTTATAPRMNRAPQIASLTFTALLRDADRLHRRAEIGIGFRHELREVVGPGVDDAESALRHEVGVFLRCRDLRDGHD